jgi:hypothetical protein
LPFVRLFIVFLIALSFALGFAEIVRQSDGRRGNQAASVRCGEGTGLPCPQPGLARLD